MRRNELLRVIEAQERHIVRLEQMVGALFNALMQTKGQSAEVLFTQPIEAEAEKPRVPEYTAGTITNFPD